MVGKVTKMDQMQALFLLHEGLAQCGPGSDAETMRAVQLLPPLPPAPRIVDLGCGTGRQSLVLARALGPLEAVDIHQPFLDELTARAQAQGLAGRVATRRADMAAPGYAPASLDLIWSEGAIYVLGFGRGLALWRPMLRDGGLLAVTELSWLVDDPPAEAAAHWGQAYPGMAGVAQNLATARQAGFAVVAHFALSAEAWLDGYYGPLVRRMAELTPLARQELALAQALDETRLELDLYRRHGQAYGYVFYILRKSPHDPSRQA